MVTRPRLGLVGYSTRALAQAASDLGFELTAVDAFCDQDALDLAECRLAERWPQDVIECARTVACDAWLLGGGMENHGRLVAQLAAQAPVLGPTRAQLIVLRSLRFLRELAASVPGLAVPATSTTTSTTTCAITSTTTCATTSPRATTAAGQHSANRPMGLYKPRRSSGGMYVAEASAILDRNKPRGGYWQEFIAGRVLGATSLVSQRGVRLLGATEALSADDWPGPLPYIYRGSVGPVQLKPRQRETLERMAARVGQLLGYRGYLQADLIEDSRGRLWLLELNPRWTAGMEVLHMCDADPASSPLAAHLTAFGIAAPTDRQPASTSAALAAKAILYAPRHLQLSSSQRRLMQSFRERQAYGENGWWNIADVPAVGDGSTSAFDEGQPILTLRVGLSSRGSQWAQARQTLLDGLNEACTQIMRRVFEFA